MAVRNRQQSLLILAGPGTGKTEVLKHRVVYLILREGVSLQDILAVTFTRKAAEEMIERLKQYPELETLDLQVSTLHSYAKQLLHRFHCAARFILDSDEVKFLIDDASRDLNITLSGREKNEIAKRIALYKARDLTPDEIQPSNEQEQKLVRIYERYQSLLTFNQVCDFSDLTMSALHLLTSDYNDHDLGIRHLLVDEFQDLTPVEHNLISRLTHHLDCFCAVGDDDQSIYSWRGANPEMITQFADKFEQAEIIHLERSWRCPSNFLQAALCVVSNCSSRLDKLLNSASQVQNIVQVLESGNERKEAWWVARWIRQNSAEVYSEIAILSPDSRLFKPITNELTTYRIPFVFWTKGGWFSKKEVKDVLAFLRILVNNDDNLALRRCLNTELGRGIGSGCINQLRLLAESEECCLWEILQRSSEFADLNRWGSALEETKENIALLTEQVLDESPDTFVRRVARRMGVHQRVVIRQLRNFAKTLSQDTSLEYFLNELIETRGIQRETDVDQEDVRNAVNIMSIHSAKGRTFDTVFLIGMDYRVFPDPNKDLDEQRRLCYVAMTRPRQNLFLCHSERRMGLTPPGVSFHKFASRFIYEIPAELKDEIEN